MILSRSHRKRVFGLVILTIMAIMLLPAVFVMAEDVPPEWQNQLQAKGAINPGEDNIFKAQGRDDYGLDFAWLATNETSQWKEYKSVTATASWWDIAWKKRMKLQFDNTGQAENLLDFPVLVVLSSTRTSYSDFKPDGTDIRFVDSDGTLLNYHIEKWDPMGNSYVWVKVPQIDSGSSSDYVWLYYDNSAATSVLNSQGTYDSNFVGVWHLNATGPSVKDATSNANHGTATGDAAYTSSGRIDGGYTFDGSGDYINVPSSTSLNLIGADFTLEAWARFDVLNNARLISKNQDTNNAYQLITDQGTGKWGLHVKESGIDRLCNLSTTAVSAGTWYYAVATVKKVGTDYSGSRLYINGVSVSYTSNPGAIGAAGGTDLQLGRRADDNPTTYLDGIEDEVRLSNTFRSSSWVRASYLTGTDAYLTYSLPEDYGVGYTPEHYGSPMKLNRVAGSWVWSNFTWNNASVAPGKTIAWKIYYNDTVGQISSTSEMTFSVLSPLHALVLVNSASPSYSDFEHRIYPYIKHFGIPYQTLDISVSEVTAATVSYSLIIIGHTDLDPSRTYLDSSEQSAIASAVNGGVGLVNFDYHLQSGGTPIYNYVQTIFDFTYGTDYSTSGSISIVTNQSYVTNLQATGNTYALSGSMSGVNIIGKPTSVTTLVNVGGYPFVLVADYGQGRAVQFSSYQLLDWNIFGYFRGIDDVFWRSFVWAARKPFVMRGIPPFVTMRIDDCGGPYEPYMEQMNGFTPLLATFLATGDIPTLKGYALAGKAYVNVHEATLGITTPEQATAFWSSYDATFTNNGIPMVNSWHPHMAETSSLLIPGMKARGIELFCTDLDFNIPLGSVETDRWGPYMKYQHSPSSRNSYIFEDWGKVDNYFFNYYSNAWAYGTPLNSVFIDQHIGDVEGAISEGVQRVKRALDSMTWGLLMTHEPAIEAYGYTNFGTTTFEIKSRLAAMGYDPIYTDADTIGYYVRAAAGTSSISYVSSDPSTQGISVTFTGKADVPTKFYLFYENDSSIESRLVDVPTFDGTATVTTGILPEPQPAQNPILVLTSEVSSNDYGDYLEEILKTEGLNEFQTEDISLVNSSYLSDFDIVVLTSMALTAPRRTMIKQYVDNGGNLIAFKPDPNLATQFGLSYTESYYKNGYLRIDNTTKYGTGITGEIIQFKDIADLYTLNGATALASLSTKTTPLSNPAVIEKQSGGTAIIFTYNLPWSIALQRQGNPEWARQERDAVTGIRPNDMFYNTTGENHWTDWDKIPLPQADEQQRFLANIIQKISSRKPLPRLWYFPKDTKTILVLTADQDGAGSSSIETELADVESYGGYWTQYLTSFGSNPDATTEQGWRTRGHETAIHYTQTSGTSYALMNSGYDAQTAQFVGAYGHNPLTVRNHAVIWLGWADSAEIAANHGIHMDVNYYHSSYAFGSTQGYFTGSGMPQKFLKQDGTVIDCYQALTELADEVQLGQQGLGLEQATQVAYDMFSKSEDGFYSAVVANFHPGGYGGSNQQWARNMMSYAQTHGIPIWSAERLYNFLNARSQASFTNLNYGSNQLTFTLNIPQNVNNLTIMIPSNFNGLLQTVTVDGVSKSLNLQTVKGIEYAFVTLNTQGNKNFVVNYGPDTTPPIISGVSVQSITQSGATIVWNTNEPADSKVKYGTTDLNSEVYDSNLVLHHSITLTGLSSGTTYQYKVQSTDASSNTAESTQSQFQTAAPDTTPPTISNVGAQSVSYSSATIVWDTNEPADSKVRYGIGNLNNEVYDGTLLLHHSITLTGLTPQANYQYRVVSKDASNNQAESAQHQFQTTSLPALSLIQTTYQDFNSGILTNAYVSNDTDGEIMLLPTLEDLFIGPNLDATKWECTKGQYPSLIPYDPTITNGILMLENTAGTGIRLRSYAGSGALRFFSPPVTIEGRIKLASTGAIFGFYDWTTEHDYFVTFGLTSGQTTSRVNLPGYSGQVAVSFSANEFHTLKIEYTTSAIRFYVDGVLRDTRTGSFSTPLPIMLGDYPSGPVYADWIRINSFQTTGTFTSGALDAGALRRWNDIKWVADTPAGTTLEFRTRSSPDGLTWSDWSAPITVNGTQITNPIGRYIQYTMSLASSNPDVSPILKYLEITTKGAPTIESCGEDGNKKDEFSPGEDIYAFGDGYEPDNDYTLYIVYDQTTWTDGMSIPTLHLVTATVHSDAYGHVSKTKVWESPLPGKYDIVVDTANPGIYDIGIDALDDNDTVTTAGFFVIPEYALGTVLALAVCFTGLTVYRRYKQKKQETP